MQKIDVLQTEQYLFYISLSIVLVSSKPQDTTMLCPLSKGRKLRNSQIKLQCAQAHTAIVKNKFWGMNLCLAEGLCEFAHKRKQKETKWGQHW